MSKKKKNVVVLSIAYGMSEGAGLAALAWLVVGYNPLAMILGGIIGVGLGIATAVETT